MLASKVQTVTKYAVFTFGRRSLLRTAGVPVSNRLCAVLPSFSAAAVKTSRRQGYLIRRMVLLSLRTPKDDIKAYDDVGTLAIRVCSFLISLIDWKIVT